MRDLSVKVLAAARAQGLHIATVESCTAGMIAAALTDIAGASDVFERGFVTYSNASKVEMVGVNPQTLDQFGAVSEQVAREMAAGGMAASKAQLVVSVTGLAGPGGTAHKPEGRVCFGIGIHGSSTSETIEFGALGRDKVRAAACEHALNLLLDTLHQRAAAAPKSA